VKKSDLGVCKSWYETHFVDPIKNFCKKTAVQWESKGGIITEVMELLFGVAGTVLSIVSLFKDNEYKKKVLELENFKADTTRKMVDVQEMKNTIQQQNTAIEAQKVELAKQKLEMKEALLKRKLQSYDGDDTGDSTGDGTGNGPRGGTGNGPRGGTGNGPRGGTGNGPRGGTGNGPRGGTGNGPRGGTGNGPVSETELDSMV